jgi:excisionase family DNA binding protein
VSVVIAMEIKAKLLTIKEAAEILYVHVNTVRRRSDPGILKSCRVDLHSNRRITEYDVNALLSDKLENHEYIPDRVS